MTLTTLGFLSTYMLKRYSKKGTFKLSEWYYVSSQKKWDIITGDHNLNKAEN